jgi:hypothetical protein
LIIYTFHEFHRMRLVFLFLTVITLGSAIPAPAQIPTAESAEQKLAQEWVTRFNRLSDWHLNPDGKESSELAEVVSSMMQLYAPDVLAEVPPYDKDQLGPVVLRGAGNVQKWTERIAATQARLNYFIKRQTGGPTGEFEGYRPVYSAPLPWGGTGIAFQIVGVWSLREDRRRFMAPGSVFLQTSADGKIKRLRLFLSEITEVVAP